MKFCICSTLLTFCYSDFILPIYRHGKYKNTWQCVVYTFKNEGPKGFYKGISASYVGISETVIHFVIYEQLKSEFRKYHNIEHKTFVDFLSFMGAAAISKTTASCLAYPHGELNTNVMRCDQGLSQD